MRISIIIIAYNQESFIKGGIQSAIAQRVDEIIVVDDGSRDATLAGIERIAAADPRVRVISQPNGGSSAARNRGAREAKGDCLLFLDGDDVLFPGAAVALVAALEAAPEAIAAYGQWNAIDEQGLLMPPNMSLRASYSGRVTETIVTKPFLLTGITLIRRTAFFSAGAFDESITFAEDWEFWCRLSLEGNFACSSARVLGYRVHHASKTSINVLRNPQSEVNKTIEKVFSNSKIREQFSELEMKQLKRESCAAAMLGVSTRNFWGGHYAGSLKSAYFAARACPAFLPRIIARLLLNLLLFTFIRGRRAC